MIKISIILFFCFTSQVLFSETVYKCISDTGTFIFTDSPCKDKIIHKTLNSSIEPLLHIKKTNNVQLKSSMYNLLMPLFKGLFISCIFLIFIAFYFKKRRLRLLHLKRESTIHKYKKDISSGVSNITWSLELIKSLEWKYFEILCSEYFTLKGYCSKLTGNGSDDGIDIFLYKLNDNNIVYSHPIAIVQCKSYTSKVSVKLIREFFGVMASEKIKQGYFMTTGLYTDEAHNFAKGKSLTLITGSELLVLIKELPLNLQNILLEKVTTGDYLTPSCPTCRIKLINKVSKKGKYIGRSFWACKNYPKCKYTMNIKK